jgi:exosome complex component RRP42
MDEDPLFDDDWEAAEFLYARGERARPPVTLLVMAVRENIIFDPCVEELAVAEVVLAVSVGGGAGDGEMDVDEQGRVLRMLAVRTIDSPSRLTHPGVPDTQNTATGGAAVEQATSQREMAEGVWQPPRGGAQRKLIALMIQRVLEPGGVAEEVLDGLDAVELG